MFQPDFDLARPILTWPMWYPSYIQGDDIQTEKGKKK
jgi:hypothetical protein